MIIVRVIRQIILAKNKMRYPKSNKPYTYYIVGDKNKIGKYNISNIKQTNLNLTSKLDNNSETIKEDQLRSTSTSNVIHLWNKEFGKKILNYEIPDSLKQNSIWHPSLCKQEDSCGTQASSDLLKISIENRRLLQQYHTLVRNM